MKPTGAACFDPVLKHLLQWLYSATKAQFSIEVLSPGSFQSLFITLVPGSLASKHETGCSTSSPCRFLQQAPPQIASKSPVGEEAKGPQAYACEGFVCKISALGQVSKKRFRF
jgi:hypothetical protein